MCTLHIVLFLTRATYTSGLVENFNGVLKMKLVKLLVDNGYRVPGQVVDVVTPLDDLLVSENDAGIAVFLLS